MSIATLASGCFWCTEAIFQNLNGVISCTSGYSGGDVENPTYEQVCSGTTNHTECLQIEYDPKVISYESLLEVFFATHDSTTPNRQGSDIGSQYRSAIFYHSEDQLRLAEKVKASIPNSVTEITNFSNFYPAENYHQNYFNTHQSAPYCQLIISPKLKKFLTSHSNRLLKPQQL